MTRAPIATVSALLFLVVSAVLADDHPVFYVDKGACPFECCTYRDWRVEKATTLYAEPKPDSPALRIAEKGTTVQAQTGEVHTRPGKLVVGRDATVFAKGDILWVYTYLGEGIFKVWYRGEFIEAEINDDWSYFEVMPHSVWWVKLKTPAGIEGWTDRPENFSNKDACG